MSFPADFLSCPRQRPTRQMVVASGVLPIKASALDLMALQQAATPILRLSLSQNPALCQQEAAHIDAVKLHLEADAAGLKIYSFVAGRSEGALRYWAVAGLQAVGLFIAAQSQSDACLQQAEILLETGRGQLPTYAENLPESLKAQLPDLQPLKGKKVAILVLSDRASRGDYQDLSGPVMRACLEAAGAEVTEQRVIPDDQANIEAALTEMSQSQPAMIMACGGTGPGPRDVTPEALKNISQRMLHGLGDYMRAESLHYVDTAWLSRMTAAMVGPSLVIAFPGSPKAVQECWEIINPFIGLALNKILKQGFE